MKNRPLVSYLSGFLLSLLFFSLAPGAAVGAGQGFVFNNEGAVSGWRFEHVNKARFTGGGLLLEGDNYVRVAPPEVFRAPAGRMAMELSFVSPKSIIVNIRVRAEDGWEMAKTARVKVVGGAEGERTLRVYLGKHSETYINDFVVEFYSTSNIMVRLDSLRFYEPMGLGLVPLLWGEFWQPDFISGKTIGIITTPEAGGVGFITMLYVIIGLAFITVLLVYRFRGRGLSYHKSANLFIIIFLLSGGLFTLRMDYNWLSVFRDDVKTLSGVDVAKRIHLVNNRDLDSFFDFIDFVKEAVPRGSAVRPATLGSNTPLAAIARYYMLPLEASKKAPFLWSYAEFLRLDPRTGALYDGKGGLIVPRARVFAKFADNAVIYEVIK